MRKLYRIYQNMFRILLKIYGTLWLVNSQISHGESLWQTLVNMLQHCILNGHGYMTWTGMIGSNKSKYKYIYIYYHLHTESWLIPATSPHLEHLVTHNQQSSNTLCRPPSRRKPSVCATIPSAASAGAAGGPSMGDVLRKCQGASRMVRTHACM